MTTKRMFTAAEVAFLLRNEANEDNDYAVDLGNGLKAVQMAVKDGLTFKIERNGKDHFLEDANAAELAEISGILRAKFAPFISTGEDESLAYPGGEDKPDAGDPLIPDALRLKPDDPNLEPDPLGLTPDALREKKDSLAGTVEGFSLRTNFGTRSIFNETIHTIRRREMANRE